MLNNRFLKSLDLINECLIYIFIIFLFMDKGETLRVIGIYLPFVFLIIKSIILRENPFNFNNSILALVFALCFSGIFSSLFAPSFLYSLEWFKRTYLKLLLISIVFLNFFQSQEKISRLAHLFIVMALIFTIFTYYDFYTKILILDEDYGKHIRKYIYPLEVFLPFVFCLFIDKQKSFKYIGLLLIIFGTVATILTGSRGGWISLFAGFFICIYGYSYLKKIHLTKLILPISCILLVISLLLIAISPTYIYGKFEQLLKGYTSLRAEMVWPAAIDSYMNLPLLNKIFGNGLGRMTYLEDFRKWYLQKFNEEPSELYSPHNFYLSVLYKQGIVGLVIFISFIFVSIKNLIKSIKLSQQPLNIRFIGVPILAVLISMIIHSFVEDMRFIQWMLIIPVTIGYINYIQKKN